MTTSAVPASKSKILSWTLFDFANTAFYVIVLTVGFPTYFRSVVAGDTADADFFWGLSFSLSMFFVALISPVLGATADIGAGKKRFLALFTGLCIAATVSLFFVEGGDLLFGMVLLIVANLGFEAGLVFYDAFLPEIATERSYGRVSGYGFAMGYLGSLVTLAVAYPLYVDGFIPENLINVRLSFILAGGFFLLFSLPLFLALEDRQRRTALTLRIVGDGYRRVRETIREIGKYSEIGKFLLSYFIFIDGVNTIIVFSGIFALKTLEFGMGELVLFFATVQTSAIVGSALFGILADHIGHKRTLSLTLVLWIAIVVAAYFVYSKTLFFAVGIAAGIALGSSQSTSRSFMSELTPQSKKTEFFGFFSFFGKAAAIVGPLVFGLVSSLINQRVGILSVGAFLVTGLILLQRVGDDRTRVRAEP